jgi:hypothetical protein
MGLIRLMWVPKEGTTVIKPDGKQRRHVIRQLGVEALLRVVDFMT